MARVKITPKVLDDLFKQYYGKAPKFVESGNIADDIWAKKIEPMLYKGMKRIFLKEFANSHFIENLDMRVYRALEITNAAKKNHVAILVGADGTKFSTDYHVVDYPNHTCYTFDIYGTVNGVTISDTFEWIMKNLLSKEEREYWGY